MAAAERVFEFLDEAEEEPAPAHPAPTAGIRGEVTFDHVRFGYTPEKVIIHDFSAHILPGQKIAIVGPTGAGKSTMVKLLMRFYDVSGGRILIDGRDIREFDRDDLRRLFGMVLQDTWLFEGTIADNIRYGRLDATDEEVEAAARAAHADHFIRTQPGGYRMVINEESSNVSQGQKQLLTIARAILADPRIMILDEATSSVDTRTEVRIQKGMDESNEGAHELHHRAPAFDHPQRGPDSGHAGRRHRRAGHARGADGEGRVLPGDDLGAVQRVEVRRKSSPAAIFSNGSTKVCLSPPKLSTDGAGGRLWGA